MIKMDISFAVAEEFARLSVRFPRGTLEFSLLMDLIYIAHAFKTEYRGAPLVKDELRCWGYGPVFVNLANKLHSEGYDDKIIVPGIFGVQEYQIDALERTSDISYINMVFALWLKYSDHLRSWVFEQYTPWLEKRKELLRTINTHHRPPYWYRRVRQRPFFYLDTINEYREGEEWKKPPNEYYANLDYWAQ